MANHPAEYTQLHVTAAMLPSMERDHFGIKTAIEIDEDDRHSVLQGRLTGTEVGTGVTEDGGGWGGRPSDGKWRR